MRIPLNWLKEYVDIKIPTRELSDKITMSGTENEILKAEEGSFEGIVVGEIIEIEKHPNADKLQVTKTSVGKETLQIVCGAPNIEVGQKIPVALVGATIGEFEIKEAELRGVKSYGMLCSESELGISDDHTGIMVLDPRAKVGNNLSSALNIGETVLDADVTPNRGDCLSMVGMAREVAVVTGQKLKMPIVKIQESKGKASDLLSVEIKDKDLCRRYMGRVIENVKIGPSPRWMQDRLSASGVRPINNVVDVTNYVMLETGQPLHAFDADRILGGKVIVRKAKKGERIETLDGVSRELIPNDLVIADIDKAVAIAGVMGGANSEVTDKTKTIVLESANFHPTAIRRTALRLALRSESSSRFEKGLSLKVTEEALERAASLLAEVADGEILGGKVDVGEKKDKEKKISLNFEKIKSFIGEDIASDKAISILESLDFKTIKKDKKSADFVVPQWRLDVSIEEDLLEEVARIYGYDKIPVTLPEGILPRYEENDKVEISKKIRNILTATGFFEAYSYSFTSKEKAGLYRKNENPIKIANALSQEQEYMRLDNLGSMLEVVSRNKDYKTGSIQKIYEISSVYLLKGEVYKVSGTLYGGNGNEVFRQAKGTLDKVFEEFRIKNIVYRKDADKSAKILSGQKELGYFVILDSEDISSFKLKSKRICFFELDLITLIGSTQDKKFNSIPKFPGSERDLTFVLDEEVTISQIYEIINTIKSEIRNKVEIVDIYRGKGLPATQKSVSLRFRYQSWERTLADKEIDDDQVKIIKKVKDALGGILRGGKI